MITSIIHIVKSIRKYRQQFSFDSIHKHLDKVCSIWMVNFVWIPFNYSSANFSKTTIIYFLLQTKTGSSFNLATIGLVCTIMTLIILLFTILPEHPKSMLSVAFTFNFMQSLGCPSILIIGNKSIRNSLKRIISVKITCYNEHTKSLFNRKFLRNQVSPSL